MWNFNGQVKLWTIEEYSKEIHDLKSHDEFLYFDENVDRNRNNFRQQMSIKQRWYDFNAKYAAALANIWPFGKTFPRG